MGLKRKNPEEVESKELEVLVSLIDARRHYKLLSQELHELEVVAKQKNGDPYYRDRDLAALLNRFNKTPGLREQTRKACSQKKRQKKVEAARTVVGEFKIKADQMTDFNVKLGSTKLPLEILEKIVSEFVKTYEPNGIRGVAITLKGLVNIAKACPDLLIAAQKGIKEFASKRPPVPVGGDWDAFFSDPYSKSIKVPDLKALLYRLRQPRSGTKDGKIDLFFFQPI